MIWHVAPESTSHWNLGSLEKWAPRYSVRPLSLTPTEVLSEVGRVEIIMVTASAAPPSSSPSGSSPASSSSASSASASASVTSRNLPVALPLALLLGFPGFALGFAPGFPPDGFPWFTLFFANSLQPHAQTCHSACTSWAVDNLWPNDQASCSCNNLCSSQEQGCLLQHSPALPSPYLREHACG